MKPVQIVLVSLLGVCVHLDGLGGLNVLAAQAQGNLRSKPVRLADLESYIGLLDAADGFTTEFNGLGLPTTQLRHWSYASRTDNLQRHRNPPPDDNLLTYDDTRVVLTKLPGDSFSDFIAANWIDDYRYQRSYIATQCPLDSTIDDFYRMIWQYNVHQVVMLASQDDIDRSKCVKYFPDTRDERGGVTIELQRKDEFPDITVRIYSLKRNGVGRVWVHYHFLSWPDTNTDGTVDPQLLLNLILKYRSSETYTKAWPIVVHCSNGTGRTGTFVLADAMIDMAKERRGVDFLAHLYHIRNQRIALVEKPEQYRLAHRVILEAYKQGFLDPGASIRSGVLTSNNATKQAPTPKPASRASPSAYDNEDSSEEEEAAPAPAPRTRASKLRTGVRAVRQTAILIDPDLQDHEIVIRVSREAQTRTAACTATSTSTSATG